MTAQNTTCQRYCFLASWGKKFLGDECDIMSRESERSSPDTIAVMSVLVHSSSLHNKEHLLSTHGASSNISGQWNSSSSRPRQNKTKSLEDSPTTQRVLLEARKHFTRRVININGMGLSPLQQYWEKVTRLPFQPIATSDLHVMSETRCAWFSGGHGNWELTIGWKSMHWVLGWC